MGTPAPIAIIGGGFAGASLAFHLTRMGHQNVLILEKEPICGYHASGRNAAMGRQITGDDHTTHYTTKGAHALRTAVPHCWEETGSFLVFADAESMVPFQNRAGEFSIPCKQASPTELPITSPLPFALHFPTDGVIDTHALLSFYLDEARNTGAQLQTNCEVRRSSFSDGQWHLETTQGPIQASILVNAAGAWAGSVDQFSRVEGPVFSPLLRHLFKTESLPLSSRAFVWAIGKEECYFRAESGGVLFCLCDEQPTVPRDVHPTGDPLETYGSRLMHSFPSLTGLGIQRTWAGIRTFTPDRSFALGPAQDAPAYFHLAGLGGHGATSSWAVGKAVADNIANVINT